MIIDMKILFYQEDKNQLASSRKNKRWENISELHKYIRNFGVSKKKKYLSQKTVVM